jgi:DNA-binding response OmpR family regulator
MGQFNSPAALSGQHVLVAEDEPLIALDVEQTLRRSGAHVAVARTLDETVLFADQPGITAAVLDIRLGQETVEPACSRLDARGVPFLFMTGLADSIDEQWRHIPVLVKPVDAAQLVSRLVSVLAEERAIQDALPKELLEVQRQLLRAKARLEQQRRHLRKMAAAGKDVAPGQRLLRAMEDSYELMRTQKNKLARDRWKRD